MTNSETGEQAGSSLEGGFEDGFKTLGHSVLPCAEVLSVAGFSALWAGFWPEGGLFSG